MIKEIYPQILIKCEDFNVIDKIPCERIITYETRLRKKHTDGKWYLQNFFSDYIFPTDNKIQLELNMMSSLKRFSSQVYLHIISGLVIPDMKNLEGKELFELDENQEEESERLKNILL